MSFNGCIAGWFRRRMPTTAMPWLLLLQQGRMWGWNRAPWRGVDVPKHEKDVVDDGMDKEEGARNA